MDERPDSSQQLMDILLVMDEKGTLQAVSGVKDGELQTKNPLEDNNDLLRVDRHGDMFSNFFSNLWNQLKDPTRFHFFRVPEEEVQRVAADFRQAGAPADGQHGASGDCHQPGGRAGRSPCQPQPQDQRAGRLPALQGQYPGGEERAYLHPGRDSPAQTGRGGGLPVPFQSQGGGAAQALPGTRAVQRSQDAARISLRRPGQAGDGCVQGEPETDRQSGGTEDLPQAGAYREVPPRTRSRGNGQGLRLGGQERKSLPRLHHMEARREARLHVPQGLQGGARRGACQARRGERGAGGGQFRGQDRRGDPQPERSPAIRTAATHRGAETAAGAQAGAERGPETGTEAGTARQAQAQPGCPSMISPAIL